MKKTHILIFFLLTMLICTATHCCYFEDDPVYIEVNLEEVSLIHLNNEGESPVINDNDPIKKEAYILCIELEVKEIENPASNYVYELNPEISSIKIFTHNDFTVDYPAGSDISKCFSKYPLFVNENIEDSTSDGYNISRVYHRKNNIYKVLRVIPFAGDHQFRVEITQANDEIIEIVSTPITLH